MRVLLFRHAEKDNFAASDPSLSSRGFKQAIKIGDLIRLGTLPQPQRLLSSPKLRARQTFEKANEILGKDNLETQVLNELNERQASETMEQFERRVKQALHKIETLSGTIFLVTHLDWIEEALVRIHSNVDLLSPQYQYWPPAQYMEFEIEDGLWNLINFKAIEG